MDKKVEEQKTLLASLNAEIDEKQKQLNIINAELARSKQGSSLKRAPTPHHNANLQNEIEVRDN